MFPYDEVTNTALKAFLEDGGWWAASESPIFARVDLLAREVARTITANVDDACQVRRESHSHPKSRHCADNESRELLKTFS